MEPLALSQLVNQCIMGYIDQYNLLELKSETKISMIEWLIEFKTTRRLYAILTESQLIELYEEIRNDEKKFDFMIQLTIYLRLNLGENYYKQWVNELLFSYDLWDYKGLLDDETYLRMPKRDDLEVLLRYPWFVTLLSFVNLNVHHKEFIHQLKRIYDAR